MSKAGPVERMAGIRHEFGEHGGVNMSIEASSTFTVMAPGTLPEMFEGKRGPQEGCYLYGRSFNPTVYHLGRMLAAMEGTEAAYGTASGLSAIAAAILHCCNSGDHIVASNTIYGGTFALLKDFLPAKAGIHTTFVDSTRPEAIRAAVTDRTRVIFAESVANPTLRVADIPMLAELARSSGSRLIVDNTFSPMLMSPADLGADVVVHSLTKFISGASDLIAGAVCADEEFIGGLMDLHLGPLMVLGPTMDPFVASKISLRLPHLEVRLQEHARRARVIAGRLKDCGVTVHYPGLEGHPDYKLLKQQSNEGFGAGGVLTLDAGSEDRASRLLDSLQNEHRFGHMAVSLGYFDTLMSNPGKSTSSELDPEDQQAAGISDGLVRLSIGYTGSLEQRWQQLQSGLRQAGLI